MFKAHRNGRLHAWSDVVFYTLKIVWWATPGTMSILPLNLLLIWELLQFSSQVLMVRSYLGYSGLGAIAYILTALHGWGVVWIQSCAHMANLDVRQAVLMERHRLLQVLVLQCIREQGYRLPALSILAIGLILGRQAYKLGNRCVRHNSFQRDPFFRCFGGWRLRIK